jgi:flagellar biosynthetic protein FliR
MEWLNDTLSLQVVVFSLVLARISGLMLVAPVLGSREIPMRVRALLAMALALVLAPAQFNTGLAMPNSVVGLGFLLAAEGMLGLVLGMGVSMLFSGIQMAGQLIAQVSGLALADVFNPTLGSTVPLFSELLHHCVLATFLLLGGHREVMAALLDTFGAIPPGSAMIVGGMDSLLVQLLHESLSLGMRAAAPTVTAQLLATVMLGLVSRTLPQLNILALGFGVNSLVTFGTLALSLGGIAWAFQERLNPVLSSVLDTLLAMR